MYRKYASVKSIWHLLIDLFGEKEEFSKFKILSFWIFLRDEILSSNNFIYTKLIQKQTKFLLPSQINSKVPISQQKFSPYKDIYFPAPSEDYCDSLYTSRCIVSPHPTFFFFLFSFLFFSQTRKVSWTPANRSKLSSSRKHSRRLIAASPGKFN